MKKLKVDSNISLQVSIFRTALLIMFVIMAIFGPLYINQGFSFGYVLVVSAILNISNFLLSLKTVKYFVLQTFALCFSC